MKKKKLIPDSEDFIRKLNTTTKSRRLTPGEIEEKRIKEEQLREELGEDKYKELKRRQYMRKKYGGNYNQLW